MKNKTRVQVTLPNGDLIFPDKPYYESISDAILSFGEFVKLFEKQGYFLYRGEKIQLAELASRCEFKETQVPDPLTQEEEAFLLRIRRAIGFLINGAAELEGLYSEGRFDINDFITEKYPFDRSFDEINIKEWAESVSQKVRDEFEKFDK